MKKISRMVSLSLSLLFALVFAFPAWVYWGYHYLLYHEYGGEVTPELTQRMLPVWKSTTVLLGYAVPVLLLVLVASLILARYSWRGMACQLFFTLSAGFFLILLTRYIPAHSVRNAYISLSSTFTYLLTSYPAGSWGGSEGLMLTLLLAPAAVGLYALAGALKKKG